TRKNKLLVRDGIPIDITDKDFLRIFKECEPFTFTNIESMFSLYQSVQYIIKNNIPGSFVECGVWKGGSAMLIAKTLLLSEITDRDIYLYDTFEGMSEPTTKDIDFKGEPASKLLNKADRLSQKSVWCYSSIDEVKNNLYSSSYPKEKLIFVKGKVEDTIPRTIPGSISLLRLDTDWYESTYHEFVHLFPLLSIKGVLIVDDYGHWKGAREATDNYFKEKNINILLNRIDYTVRIGIKN
ncbi:MAG: TylF/MycF/NovP-related O-methyltransferase, partial [Bacteroidia bacterium]